MRSVLEAEAQPFDSLEKFAKAIENPPSASRRARDEALERNSRLTKPAGSLGRLEELAVWFASWKGLAAPELLSPRIVVFAANHGVAARGVSAYPAQVTAQMVANFESGGAAINQLARTAQAELRVHVLSLDRPTRDIAEGPAMNENEAVEALCCGWRSVSDCVDLLVVGEMGIGNTTSASAIALALFGGSAGDWTGAGTGVSGARLKYKSRIVEQAVGANKTSLSNPLEILRCLGGREIAAMAGAIARARGLGIPVILDGFVCTAAASVLHAVDASLLDHAVAGHLSKESSHGKLLSEMGMSPLLDLGMRLGEASGAALAIGLLRSAVELHRGMSTFEEAGVSSAD
ncbi:MAG: nicotinate-nucleotide--dimethylbenzimidazole phosphoribosyltransferase [Albidovulum sp.]|nr:nicotinate-nucleotide--dimethylbenzimidazole phosphoribosyltransferase [Albidovulum sp.]